MEYYTKAIEILDKQIKKDKLAHLIGKHSAIYETSLKAIMEALIITDVGCQREQLITFLMKVGDCYGMELRENAERCVDEILSN